MIGHYQREGIDLEVIQLRRFLGYIKANFVLL